MNDEGVLYDVGVDSKTSPAELLAFCELLESNGYTVVTDLEYGALKICDRDGESA